MLGMIQSLSFYLHHAKVLDRVCQKERNCVITKSFLWTILCIMCHIPKIKAKINCFPWVVEIFGLITIVLCSWHFTLSERGRSRLMYSHSICVQQMYWLQDKYVCMVYQVHLKVIIQNVYIFVLFVLDE
jgi:hypothetical protein